MVFDCEYSLSKCTCVQIKINKCIQKAVHLFDAIYFLHSENVKIGSNKIYWFVVYINNRDITEVYLFYIIFEENYTRIKNQKDILIQ